MGHDATRLLNDVSPDLADTVLDQGWDDHSVMIHLLGFINEQVPGSKEKLETYFDKVAEEENDASASFGGGI